MRSALIGHTGFVGSTILRQQGFSDLFNSRNVAEIAGQRFDLVVCAGVSAVKWKANKEPEADREGIAKLLRPLETVTAERFVLISTVDVYPISSGVDEHAAIDPDRNHPYGKHRFEVEEAVRDRFPAHHVIRLPGLFGTGLKKNVIYDLLNDNCLDAINPDGSFQYYPLDRLWKDITAVTDSGMPLVNFATEPIRTDEIVAGFFPDKAAVIGAKSGTAASYDIHTAYAGIFGGKGPYMMDREQVLDHMRRFVGAYAKQP